MVDELDDKIAEFKRKFDAMQAAFVESLGKNFGVKPDDKLRKEINRRKGGINV